MSLCDFGLFFNKNLRRNIASGICNGDIFYNPTPTPLVIGVLFCRLFVSLSCSLCLCLWRTSKVIRCSGCGRGGDAAADAVFGVRCECVRMANDAQRSCRARTTLKLNRLDARQPARQQSAYRMRPTIHNGQELPMMLPTRQSDWRKNEHHTVIFELKTLYIVPYIYYMYVVISVVVY